MRTADECLKKAVEMERHAARDGVATRADWLGMARHWRNLAHEAMWQDRCGAAVPPSPTINPTSAPI